MRKLVNGRAAYSSHLLLPARKHKYKFLSQKIMAKDTFFWRKAMTNLKSIVKSRHITLLWFFQCESWTLKKAEYQRTDAFKLWCWRRVLRVPCIARSSQSTLKEISPEYWLESLMMKLNLNTLATGRKQPTHWKRPCCWGKKKKLKAEGEEGNRGWGGWMALSVQWTGTWANSKS